MEDDVALARRSADVVSWVIESGMIGDYDLIFTDMPPEVRQVLMTTRHYCNADNDLIFRYSTAATGIAGIVSRNPDDCR